MTRGTLPVSHWGQGTLACSFLLPSTTWHSSAFQLNLSHH